MSGTFNEEYSLQAFSLLGDLMPGGLFVYRADDSQEMLYFNTGTLRIFGCADADEFRALTGNTFRGLVHPDDYQTIQDSIDRQIAGSSDEKLDFVSYRISRRDGAVRTVSDFGRLVTLPDFGEVYVVFITDETDRMLEHEQLRHAEREMEHEHRLNELRSEFLFSVSHDIRTPLNAVTGFSELARRHIGSPELLADYLDKTVSAARQLDGMIGEMLELNRIHDGGDILQNEECDLSEQLSMALDLFRIPAEEKNLNIVEHFELPDRRVLVDPAAFRRIIGNLLSNAVKFTPPGGTVTLRASCGGVSDTGFADFVFSVSDTGPGIPEHLRSRLFLPFERAESSTQSGKTGMGLGLFTVRSLLELMGGSIRADSGEEGGSVFTAELPLEIAGGEPGSGTPEEEKPLPGKRRILVAEDILINREIVLALLREEGFLAEAVPDGSEAVEAVRSHPPGYYDLVLMDIQMPVMNGYEAAKAIRALPGAYPARLPILALSANSREEDRLESLRCGMNGHIAKPFDIGELVKVINSHIGTAPR